MEITTSISLKNHRRPQGYQHKNWHQHQWAGAYRIPDATDWCNKCFKDDEWLFWWETFYFKNEEDYVLFLLKWK